MEDGAHAHYPEHTHRTETAHIILSGEMTLTMAGETKTYRSGERCDVPAGAVHAAKMGQEGAATWLGKIIHARQSGLFEDAVQEFHDMHDVLAGFVDFGAGA